MLFDVSIIDIIKNSISHIVEFKNDVICDYDGIECDVIIIDNTIIINKARIDLNVDESDISNILSNELGTYVNVTFENIDYYNSSKYVTIIIDIEE